MTTVRTPRFKHALGYAKCSSDDSAKVLDPDDTGDASGDGSLARRLATASGIKRLAMLTTSFMALVSVLMLIGFRADRHAEEQKSFNEPEKMFNDRSLGDTHWSDLNEPIFAQCCKVVKEYRIDPGVDWGIANFADQAWFTENNCIEVVGRGVAFDERHCKQAAVETQCCQVAKDYGINPGTTWGWAADSVKKWWEDSNCDIAVGSGGDFKSALCEKITNMVWSQPGGKNLGVCLPRFRKPDFKAQVTENNGVRLTDACFSGEGPHHAFIIGDWGGLPGNNGPEAAKHLGHRKERGQDFVYPTDVHPQLNVRDQMANRAKWADPDYILNVGDNFYWGGINDYCGAPDITKPYSNGWTPGVPKVNQFKECYENVYNGPGIDGKQWLGVLGNHDYGGWLFTHAWDQMIGYTWSRESWGRWFTPALYYQVSVRYPDFIVDYYFLDTNVWDALDPNDNDPHNICSLQHNGPSATCPSGLSNVWTCPGWFKNMWQRQKDWLDEVVPLSVADWRIVVTHFPPYFGMDDWKHMAHHHQFDLIISGHRHSQFTRTHGDKSQLIWPDWGKNAWKAGFTDFLDPVSWVVSGGGGGVTSEHAPEQDGHDDQYGFMDLTLSKEKLTVESISHTGVLRHKIEVGHVFNHTSTTSTSTTFTNTTTSTTTTSVTTSTTTTLTTSTTSTTTRTLSSTTTTTTTTSTTYGFVRWMQFKMRGMARSAEDSIVGGNSTLQ